MDCDRDVDRPERTDQPARRPWPAAAVVVAVLTTAAVFLPALDIYLIADDFEWLDQVVPAAARPTVLLAPVAGFFRPVVGLSYLLDFLRYATDAVGYMATTLAIHLLNVALLAVFVRRLCDSDAAALTAALLFGVSPLHFEATLWAAARPDSLLLTASLATLLLLDLHPTRAVTVMAATAGAVVAAGCKESWVILPVAALGLHVVARRRAPRAALAATAPLFLVLLVYLVVFLVVPAARGARLPTAYASGAVVDGVVRTGATIAAYVGLEGLGTSEAQAAAVGYAALAAIAAWAATTRQRVVLWGLAWMVLALLPALPVGFQPSRYNYVPLAGFWLAVGGLVADARDRLGQGRPLRLALVNTAVAVALGVLTAVSASQLAVEIDAYLAFGDVHRQLVAMYREVGPEIPRERPLLFVNLGTRTALEDFVFESGGRRKIGHPRPGGLWQVVDLGPVATFAGSPLAERMIEARASTLAALLAANPSLLVFEDDGFTLAATLPPDLRRDIAAHGRLPTGGRLFRFVQAAD